MMPGHALCVFLCTPLFDCKMRTLIGRRPLSGNYLYEVLSKTFSRHTHRRYESHTHIYIYIYICIYTLSVSSSVCSTAKRKMLSVSLDFKSISVVTSSTSLASPLMRMVYIASAYCKCLLLVSIASVYCTCLLQVSVLSVYCECLL